MAKKVNIMEFPTKYTESVQIGTFETFNKPSMTEPDNAMSIPEIIARFTRGYGLEVPVRQWESGSAFEGEDPEAFFDDFGPAVQQEEPAQQQPAQQSAQEPAQQQPAQQQQEGS